MAPARTILRHQQHHQDRSVATLIYKLKGGTIIIRNNPDNLGHRPVVVILWQGLDRLNGISGIYYVAWVNGTGDTYKSLVGRFEGKRQHLSYFDVNLRIILKLVLEKYNVNISTFS
jgi:hypothetical protein